MIADPHIRCLLFRYFHGIDSQGNGKLKPHEYRELRDSIKAKFKFMQDVFAWIDTQPGDFSDMSPPTIAPFFRNLFVTTSLCGFLTNPKKIKPLLSDICEGVHISDNVVKVSTLIDCCPMLISLLKQFSYKIPVEFKAIFTAIHDHIDQFYNSNGKSLQQFARPLFYL